MRLLLLALLVAAPPAKKHWTKSGVGIWFPPTWEVLEQEEKGPELVVKGPRLGTGNPRLALMRAGPASEGLDDFGRKLVTEITKRPSWAVTAKARKQVGPYPGLRLGFTFTEGGTKGRARATIVLLGSEYYVLELSAPASHFPGSIFDRIEQSLEVKWTEHKVAGLVVPAPSVWKARQEGESLRLFGPNRLQLVVERAPPEKPKNVGPGPKVRFLGEARESVVIERVREDRRDRMLIVEGGDRVAVVIMPVPGWDDVFPLVEAVLERVKRAPRD